MRDIYLAVCAGPLSIGAHSKGDDRDLCSNRLKHRKISHPGRGRAATKAFPQIDLDHQGRTILPADDRR
jgi:hypothetical protein